MTYKKANAEVVKFDQYEFFMQSSYERGLEIAKAFLDNLGYICNSVRIDTAKKLICSSVTQTWCTDNCTSNEDSYYKSTWCPTY